MHFFLPRYHWYKYSFNVMTKSDTHSHLASTQFSSQKVFFLFEYKLSKPIAMYLCMVYTCMNV